MAENLKIGREYVLKFVGKEKLTSVDFVETFRVFDKDNSGYLENEELDDFLIELFRKVNLGVEENVAVNSTPDLSKLKREILEHADLNKDGKIEISELAIILPKDENFLLKFKTKQRKMKKISSVDFMKIWSYYDQDGNGFLDEKELRGFSYDLLTKTNIAVKTPKEMQDDVDDLVAAIKISCRKSGRVELHHMKRLLPVEKNFLEPFPRCSKMSEEDIEKVFRYYDRNEDGGLEGEELLAFLKDLLERQGGSQKKTTMAAVETFKNLIMQHLGKNDDDGKLTKRELMDYCMLGSGDVKYTKGSNDSAKPN